MDHKTLKISGVSVLFPCKPYPSQLSMMDKVIKGISRRQNCLLESPTGSGKSLALLCSSLAWQGEEKEKKENENALLVEKALCTCECHAQAQKETLQAPTNKPVAKDEKDVEILKFEPPASNCPDDDCDFKTDSYNFNKPSVSRRHITVAYEDDGGVEKQEKLLMPSEKAQTLSTEDKSNCLKCACSPEEKLKRKVPKIYFGTRTHKQVAQIVKELRKTGYDTVKMTILGSREHTCIHPEVSKMKKKNEGCKELLNGPGCPLKDRVLRYTSHDIIKNHGLDSAWDLEDLIKMCQPKKVCPYFLSRGLKEDADLIICPYNYLVDPLIREAMQINLKGNIVIFDEAHNIEDSAREAASQTISQENIATAVSDIEVLMESHNLADYSRLRHMLKKLDSFIDDNKDKLEQKDFNQSYKIWNGFYIVAQLETLDMGPKHFPDLKSALARIKCDAEERKEEAVRQGWNPDLVEMKPVTQSVLEQLFMIMDYLYRNDLKYVEDYRASLVHSVSYVPKHTEGQWLSARNRNTGRMMAVDNLNLNFWCMNPGVAFSDFSDTRSVILTSGTLSPLASFQSELGVDFKIQLEANHVIKDSQVWVGTLGQGPNGTSLQAVYRNLETYSFQDELGNLVLKVCETVPHGVLCFLPSYKVLEKLKTRWETTGLMTKLRLTKVVLCEPHGSDKADFELRMQQFYDAVNESSRDTTCVTDEEFDTASGAIMFAVCRGKVSEGLDFADNFARAVISVGIPYPNFKDVQVELKRKYNDEHTQARGLLTGHAWYEIQAFRALNQALGRCIRHRNDWGALIIVDDRFIKNPQKYCQGLSKWVRNKIHTYDKFRVALNSLTEFVDLSKKKEEENQASDIEKSILSPPPTPDAKELVYKNSSPQLNASRTKAGVPYNSSPVKNFPIFLPLGKFKTEHPSKKRNSGPNFSWDNKQMSMQRTRGMHQISPPSISSTSDSFRSSYGSEGNRSKPPSTEVALKNNRPSLQSDNAPSSNTTTETILDPDNISAAELSGDFYLRVVVDKVKPGDKCQLVVLPKHLQKYFGGNFNLPASNSERRVYVVTPPVAKGKPPMGDLIMVRPQEIDSLPVISVILKGSKKEADKGSLEDLTTTHKDSSLLSHENSELENERSKEESVTPPPLPTTDDVKYDKDRSLSEHEVDDSFNAVDKNIEKHNAASHPKLDSRKANPFLKFSRMAAPKEISPRSTTKEAQKVDDSSSSALTSSAPSPILFSPDSTIQHGESSPKSASRLSSKKPLFKTKKLLSTLEETERGEKDQSLVEAHTISGDKLDNKTTPNVRMTSAKELNQAAEDFDSDFAESGKEEKLIVKRKNKRRSLSMKKTDKKKIKMENCHSIGETQGGSNFCSFLCVACASSFFDEPVSEKNFAVHKKMPSFLCQDAEDGKKLGCFFFHISLETRNLQPPTEGYPGLSIKYIEQEEICVQFLYCGQCLEEWSKDKESGPPSPVGAKVKLAAGSSARFKKGQIWLFLHAVKEGKALK